MAGLADRIAVGLAERGVSRGDRVGVVLGNRPAAIFVWFAVNRLGAIAVLLSPAAARPELAGLLALTQPRLVVADDHAALAQAALADLNPASRPVVVTPDVLMAAGSGSPRARVVPDDIAVLLATSGTTGTPKAVAQTHRAYALTAEAFPWWLGLTASDRLLTALPLHHVNAQAYSTLGALAAGANLVLLPKFSASGFWHDVRRHGATQFNAVGAMIHILLKNEARTSDRDHAVRVAYSALALPEPLHAGFERRFGLSMLVGYGLSESTFGTVWPRSGAPRYGTMGTLRQHPRLGTINRARVVREDGSDASVGEAGELWLSNPATMASYWNDPHATRTALSDGWLRTGDLVSHDADGVFTFVARKKDVIRRRGENVAAAEIEAALMAHPSVLEAAVVGVASELGEEEIVAYVAPASGAVIDVETLKRWLRERLAAFKVPSVIRVRDALPRTATERIAKHLLE